MTYGSLVESQAQVVEESGPSVVLKREQGLLVFLRDCNAGLDRQMVELYRALRDDGLEGLAAHQQSPLEARIVIHRMGLVLQTEVFHPTLDPLPITRSCIVGWPPVPVNLDMQGQQS